MEMNKASPPPIFLFTKLTKDSGKFFSNYKPPYLIEPKLDGEDLIIVRCVDKSIYAFNRYGTIYKNLPFFNSLPLFSFIARGEMYPLQGDFYDLKAMIKSGDVGIKIHDLLLIENIDLRNQPLSVRKQKLESFDFKIEPLGIAESKEQVYGFYNYAIKNYEGIVVKPLNSRYVDNIWLKMKKKLTYDVLLTAIRKTDSLTNNQAWSFRMEAYRNGKLVYLGCVSSGFDYKLRMFLANQRIAREDKEFLYFENPIVAEVECLELNNKMRNPKLVRLRFDKPVDECVIV